MGMSVACAAASPRGYRLAKVVLAIGVVAGLAWGAGVSAVSGRAAVAVPRPAAWAVTATDPVFGNDVLAVNPQTHTVYTLSTLSETGTRLSVVNGLTGKITGAIVVPLDAIAGAINPATGTLYITTEHAVAVIDAQTGKSITTIPDAMSPGQVVVDQETDTIYVLNASTVSVIDGSTNSVTATIDIGPRLTGIAIDQITDTIYVASFDSNSVSVIDGSTNTVKTAIEVGQFPRRITVDPATDKIYVANNGDDSISEINGATNTVTATFGADASAGLVADPQTDTIYALGFSGSLQGIDGRTKDVVVTFTTAEDPSEPGGTVGEMLAIDPAAGILYAINAFSSPDGPDTFALAIITSCSSHVIAPAGSNCAKVAADFEPAAVNFASPKQGVAVGTTSCLSTECSQAAMMATADGGKHWSFLSPPTDISIEPTVPAGDGLLFTSQDNGWLFGAWHTRNGGATWQHGGPPGTFFNNGSQALALAASTTTVYAAVRPNIGHGQFFTTPVGAVRWTRVPAINQDATGLAVSGRSVWVTGSTHMWASADGRHWARYSSRCPGTGYRLAGVTATSPSRVALLCARPTGGQSVRKEVLVSTDGGRTVHLAGTAPVAGIPQGFASPPGDPSVITIAAAGAASSGTYWIYRSANGGKTWTTQTIHGDAGDNFRSLTYTSRTTGWVVLANRLPAVHNMLLHTTDGGRTWHKATM